MREKSYSQRERRFLRQKQPTFQTLDNSVSTEIAPCLFLSGAPPLGLVGRCEVDAPTMIGLSWDQALFVLVSAIHAKSNT